MGTVGYQPDGNSLDEGFVSSRTGRVPMMIMIGYNLCMTVQIAVRISREVVEVLDDAVARGEFATRTEAVRVALDELARRLRDQEIAEEYRRAYTAKPQEEWTGDLGLSLLGTAIASENRTAKPRRR